MTCSHQAIKQNFNMDNYTLMYLFYNSEQLYDRIFKSGSHLYSLLCHIRKMQGTSTNAHFTLSWKSPLESVSEELTL
jgi:hypothetical protein